MKEAGGPGPQGYQEVLETGTKGHDFTQAHLLVRAEGLDLTLQALS